MTKLTWMENHVWGNLGWLFIEIAANCPDWLWWALGWTFSVGNWFYQKAYSRYDKEMESHIE